MLNRFAAAFALCTAVLSPLSAATVRGKVSFVTRRGQAPLPSETLVWLEPAAATRPRKPETVSMTTRGKMLIPHVLAIPVGSTVQFPNEDPISHNLFSVTQPNSFDLGLYRRGSGKTHTFSSPGIVNVYCNVHSNMSAVIHVMATPYYAFPDETGNYSIEVPAGRYRLVAWNEQGGAAMDNLDVDSSGAVKGVTDIVLDTRNFRATAHRNKFGQPYRELNSRDY